MSEQNFQLVPFPNRKSNHEGIEQERINYAQLASNQRLGLSGDINPDYSALVARVNVRIYVITPEGRAAIRIQM